MLEPPANRQQCAQVARISMGLPSNDCLRLELTASTMLFPWQLRVPALLDTSIHATLASVA